MRMTKGNKRAFASIGLVTASLFLVAGCSSGTSTNSNTTSNTPTGSAFVVGTDAPMASVTSFVAQLQSVTATDASGNTVSLVSGSPTIDFARYNGLQTLLDLNNVPEGTYTSVQITLGPTATIGYLNVTGTSAPTIQTMNATLTSQTATVTLANPLVVASAAAPVGLRVDFQIAKSIQVDSSGNITGTVTPTFKIDSVGVDQFGDLCELAAGFLNRLYIGRALREADDSGRFEIRGGAARHVIENDRDGRDGASEGEKVLVLALLRGFVVIRIGGEYCVNSADVPEQAGLTQERPGGVVRAARPDWNTASRSVNDEMNHVQPFILVQRGRFAGRAAGDQKVYACINLPVDERAQRRFINCVGSPVRLERRDNCGAASCCFHHRKVYTEDGQGQWGGRG